MTPYDPNVVQSFYDARAEKEWLRLDKDAVGKLIYAVHEKAIRDIVNNQKRVLELGSGAGRFSSLLADISDRLVVSDISLNQISFNRRKMSEIDMHKQIAGWLQCDICNIPFADESFDTIICVGGPLSYVFENETQALGEMLRVLSKGGCLLLGVMCLPGVIRNALAGLPSEFAEQGPDAAEWVLRTGKQDGIHYSGVNNHHVHLMRASEIVALVDGQRAIIEKTYCGGFLATASFETVQAASEAPAWVWEKLVQAEISFCESPELLEAGTHMIFRIRKP